MPQWLPGARTLDFGRRVERPPRRICRAARGRLGGLPEGGCDAALMECRGAPVAALHEQWLAPPLRSGGEGAEPPPKRRRSVGGALSHGA